jgi:hypothetical protein
MGAPLVEQASGLRLSQQPSGLLGDGARSRPTGVIGEAEACAWSMGILATGQEPIPKGLQHSAQGCAPSATLGVWADISQPCKGWIIISNNPFRPSCRKTRARFSSVSKWHTTNRRRGIVRRAADERCNPFRVRGIHVATSQGSARRATLGSVISSLQDEEPCPRPNSTCVLEPCATA